MDFQIECPHCKKEDPDMCECLSSFADEFVKVQCGYCERYFKLKWNSYFETEKVEDGSN